MPYVKKDKHLEYVSRLEEAQNGRDFWRVLCIAQFATTIILNYVGWL